MSEGELDGAVGSGSGEEDVVAPIAVDAGDGGDGVLLGSVVIFLKGSGDE